MEIIVCVKCVPETAEADIRIDSSERDIDKAGLVFDINEWDEYAVEEALRIKEKHGGTITVITVGSENSDKALRKCLAKGVDHAIRISDPKLEGADAYAIARVLSRAIIKLPYDLILTGTQASDDGCAVVGPALAEFLGIPSVTLVKKIEFKNGIAKVNRELEGGLEEVVEVRLPAVISVQTGINEPRYVSIMGIRRASQKEIKVVSLTDLGLNEAEAGAACSWISIEKMYVPPVVKQTDFIKGSPAEIANRIVEILKARGLI
ncbi:MAG: electron transfer flavoprotein subunit beta/FixA family protein [Nitrososphaerota archaeon]|nr:electron transfer flavoprotein subunit beta/FixA family protein [Candidatus Bathyarchaeota archaeon]MDW8023701.1 electron transfer flavoprotein subunit beta/FixA family protein [Nitrososphaerota archaeon]